MTPVVAPSSSMLKGRDHLAYWERVLKLPQLVYVIGEEFDGPVKIGTASKVDARIATLQTGNPRPLMLFHVVPGGSIIENRLHHLFADLRVRPGGEWFGGSLTDLLGIHHFVGTLAEMCVEVHDGGPEAPEIGHRWTPFMRGQPQRISIADQREDTLLGRLQQVGGRG